MLQQNLQKLNFLTWHPNKGHTPHATPNPTQKENRKGENLKNSDPETDAETAQFLAARHILAACAATDCKPGQYCP